MLENATKLFTENRVFAAACLFVIAFTTRMSGPVLIGPYDDAYHWKRIAWVADHSNPVAHGLTAIDFDRDRGSAGAFCPWPPLYDFGIGMIARLTSMDVVPWIPPIAFSLFAAALVFCCGLRGGGVAGLTVALAPYLIGISRVASIDHHWAEPILVVLILFSVSGGESFTAESAESTEASASSALSAVNKETRLLRDAITMAAAMTAALFVQTALVLACGIAMLAIVFFRRDRAAAGALAFAMTAAIVAGYRLTRPPAYPSNTWFLGWTHVALLVAAAVTCAVAARWPRWVALVCGVGVLAPFAGGVASGARFFAGDAWLQSIVEFQPMFRDPSRIGTDAANVGGGLIVLLVLVLSGQWPVARGQGRRTEPGEPVHDHWPLTIALFASVYFVLALSSRRFLVPAIALFALSGAVAATSRRRAIAAVAIAATLLPPLAWHAYALVHPERSRPEPVMTLAAEVVGLPRGRVLGPWHAGHAIDVLGGHAVVIDNFGSMPDAALFVEANRALLATDGAELAAWCRGHDVQYLALADPSLHMAAAAVCSGAPRELYAGTSLAARTVWSRLWRGETIRGYSRVRAHVWRIDAAAR